MQRGAEQPVQEHISGTVVGHIIVRHAIFELDMTNHPELAGGRSGRADVIRLHGTGDQDGIGLL